AIPEPFRSNTSNVTFAALPEVFVTAIPLRMLPCCPIVPDASTYIRNAVPRFAGAPASVTVNAPGLKVKTTSGVGAAPPPVGTTRTDPVVLGPEVTNRCELRGATEYGAVLVD